MRLAAVEEIPLDEQDLLAAIAKEDSDPRVRRAAVKKLTDLSVVAAIRDADTDEGVREEGSQLIVDTALGSFEGTTEEESNSALALIREERELAGVAKEAASERVARAALSRVSDEKFLGSIARRSVHPAIRLEALARVRSVAELAAVALRSEFKDVALAAVERVSDAGALEAIAGRAKSKPAARAARVALKKLEPAKAGEEAARGEPAAVETAAQTMAAPEADSAARRAALCEAVESLGSAGGRDFIASRLEKASAAWAALPPAAPELQQRFDAATARVRARLLELDEEGARRARQLEALRATLLEREGLVQQAEALVPEMTGAVAAGEGAAVAEAESRVAATLEKLRGLISAWEAMPAVAPDEGPEGASLAKRFRAASAACQQVHQQWTSERARKARLEQLASELEAAVRAANLAEARRRWSAIKHAWDEAVGDRLVDEVLRARVDAALAALRTREEEARELRSREERENLERLTRLAAQAEDFAGRPDLALKDCDRAVRDLKAALEQPGSLPSRQDREAIVERLRKAHAALASRLQELREADEWQRWANATIQEELCHKAEALASEPDPAEAARKLRDLQAQWKKVTLVPRDRSQALWLRFKAAQDAVRATTDRYFAAQAEERAANLARKEELCQKAEALSASTDWVKTAEAIKALQAEWKTVGPVPKGREKAVWDRFHAACDAFFTRRREDLARRKQVWAANLARKQALIAEVDSLGSDGDWERATRELRRIQAEWRGVGPVRKKHSEEVWQRFQEALNRFQERYVQRDEFQVSASVSEREAACAALESLLSSEERARIVEAGAVATRLRDAWSRWERSGPVPAEALAALTERFRRAFAGVVAAYADQVKGTEFDVESNLRKMEDLCRKVEELAPEGAVTLAEQSPAAILAAKWREALAANTIAGAASAAAEEARRRAAAETVRDAQAAWKRIGPVPDDLARPLAVRFQKACSRALEQRRRKP
ncbi:MAG: DUF349 domain-containing protein [Vicinamibacterales bacterium]